MSNNNDKLKKAFKKSMKKNKGNKKAQFITIILFAIIGLMSFVFGNDFNSNTPENLGNVSGNLEVSYLDVGQGDAAYIRVNDFDILIDAGPRSEADHLLKQLEEKNIDDFEMVIATHPHEDHIGGMTKIFQKYKVENFYMPKVTHTTKTFENMLNAVSNEGIKIQTIKEGMKFDLGSGAKIDVYSPIKESYEEFNNYSPIMKLTFGDKKLMFTGDAETLVEQEVLSKYSKDLKADVLKFGHHGSSTSSSNEFIQAVSPQYGIISCGTDNSYGHPHKETMSKISKNGIETYRTDLQGEITVTSNGKTISVKTKKS
ncbi:MULTISPECIES: ComEC/Rec2 family competence protein [Clostridium]|uniref:ComEC/Rec2 family competence protein n=1 Tax=Clostridium aquiflavi TaxID=3073603 RepID=A0ABU1EEL6_9CLOT|nr:MULTISPECIES: ComEC/Rec2 family competence protein [unclassified Clostridium]MDR5586723.1 ComEC/Rec2 family competence protein [Clostridium sp. 5N-1]NFG62313.1 MBL fold metallo-hydrolase [Clostridium botulinum]NFQ09650.1 MBL fold metallo-hydrolase [Clostridium botulinum]